MRYAIVIFIACLPLGNVMADDGETPPVMVPPMPVQQHIPVVEAYTMNSATSATPGPMKKRTFIREGQPTVTDAPPYNVWGVAAAYTLMALLLMAGWFVTRPVKPKKKKKLSDPMLDTNEDLEAQIDNKLLRKHRADRSSEIKT